MLDLFQDLKIDEQKLHQKYKTIKDNLFLTGEHEVLKDWVNGFEDRDNKIVQEFQTTFHSSFWEFYLYAVFKELNFKIDFSKNRPDFIIKSPYKLYIEAVVSNIKQTGEKEDKRTFEDILSMLNPPHLQDDFYKKLDESIVRHSNAISSKSKKYLLEYSKLDFIDNEVPYIIALSGYDQINYGNQYIYPMMALLYGAYFNIDTEAYKKEEFIIKPNSEAKIDIGLFNTNKFEHISAIIFSATITLGKLTSLSLSQNKSLLKTNFVINVRHDTDKPNWQLQLINENDCEDLTDGLFIFHNPFAKNKLDENIFKNTGIMEIKQGKNGHTFENNRLPLFSRFNNFGKHNFIIKSLMFDTFNKFNAKDHIRMSFFKILEIDFNIQPKEVTILDIELNLQFIVDLKQEDIDSIENMNLKENDSIIAIIYATLDKFGNTAQWNFQMLQQIHNKT